MADIFALPWGRIETSSPLVSRMAAWAAREIVEQRLGEDSMLTESDLAREWGTSRTPAREAMLQLEQWRLVRLVPKKGAFITRLSLRDRRELLAIRAMFEADALPALNEPGVVDELAIDLRRIVDGQTAALRNREILDLAGYDFAFHARIAECSSNSVVEELSSSLAPRFARLAYEYVMDYPDLLDEIVVEHERLTVLAEHGRVTEFGELLDGHIQSAFPALLSTR